MSADDGTQAASMRIPVDLQPILRDYTKAVLKEKPEDVLAFSRDYFFEKYTAQRVGAPPRRPARGDCVAARARGD
jgi:hypothetical protein